MYFCERLAHRLLQKAKGNNCFPLKNIQVNIMSFKNGKRSIKTGQNCEVVVLFYRQTLIISLRKKKLQHLGRRKATVPITEDIILKDRQRTNKCLGDSQIQQKIL